MPKRKYEPSEEGEQEALIEWCDIWANRSAYADLRWVFHVPNGGKREGREAAKLQRMGVRAGVADLLWLRPAGIAVTFDVTQYARAAPAYLVIEMKKRGGKQRDEQVEFEHFVESRGGRYYLAYSAGEAATILCRWAGWTGDILESAKALDEGRLRHG